MEGGALKLLARYGSVLLVVALGEAVARLHVVNPVLFPPATVIVAQLVALLADGTLVYHAAQSLYRMLIGLALALAIGVPLGIVMGRSRRVDRFMSPLFAFGFPVPKIGLIPIVIVFFGLGHLGKIVLVFVDALFPIVLNAYHGGKLVDHRLVWSARAMGDDEPRILRRVVWPAALPHVFTGIRLGVVIALIVVFLSEMVVPGSGLGHLMMIGMRNFKIVEMYAAILSVALLGWACDSLVLLLRGRLLSWYEGEAAA